MAKMMRNNIITITIFQFLLFFNAGKGFKIQNEGDHKFKNFIRTTMSNYSSWLKEKQLDPSPPTKDIFVSGEGGLRPIYLECALSDKFLKGHSENFNDLVTPISNFSGLYFGLEREVQQTFEFHGNLNCSGEIKQEHFPELEKNLPFSGQGKFVITLKNITEGIIFKNVGITSEYKLDMSHSWPIYGMVADIKNIRLKADWNNTLISSLYKDIVETTFVYIFEYKYLLRDDLLNPACQLLESYLNANIIEHLDLRSIVPPEDLPPINVPTPTTTTIRTTTTTTTAATTTRITTTPTTTPNVGPRLIEQTGLIFIHIICPILYDMLKY